MRMLTALTPTHGTFQTRTYRFGYQANRAQLGLPTICIRHIQQEVGVISVRGIRRGVLR